MRSLFGKKHKDHAASSSSSGLHKKPTGGKVFGTALIDVCEREKTEIPQVATEVMEYLDKNGLKVEGIFRIPGNSIQIQQLQDYYDCTSDVLTIDTVDDVHAVACVLKQYLRDLPDPLLTHRFYDTFIAIMKNPDYDYRISNIKKLITALPPAHKSLLQHLFSFLLRVAAQSDVNKMTFPNLAIVFGPNLLRPRHESMLRMIEDARHVNSLIKLLLEEYEFLIMGTTDKPKNSALYKKPDPTPAPASAPVVAAAGSAPGSAPSTPKGPSTNPAIAGGRAHTHRRRAFKFDPADLSTQTFTEDESVDPGEKEARVDSPARPRRAVGGAAATASIGLAPSKRISAIGVILMTPEMEQEVKEFDLARPLQHAMSLLNVDRQKCARGADCSTMNPLQLKAEKAAVKRILRNFDVSFKEKHGHLPTKADKEPLRPLYQQYRELTQIIDNTVAPPVPARATGPKPSVVDEQQKLLRKEKRQLQLFLHKYQEEFIARNGRKVQYLEDRLPVQREYDRYKELKLQLADGD
eukprot:TRINITY_DN5474_c0_g1_i2.p1 TRINITY_DN5474_c0_g1~~TRINITY_DN5474_c0_g1_i2.p1  ORF type:complete len:522 (+),score=188.24 TRINITY_DN5474_c0_g1_i2:231-1796(+)